MSETTAFVVIVVAVIAAATALILSGHFESLLVISALLVFAWVVFR